MLKLRSSQKINCSTCSVYYLCLAKGLDLLEMQTLNATMSYVKVVEKGSHIFYAQDPMNYLYAVYSGSCKAYWLDENGNMRIDNFYLPGDIIGLESIPNRKHFFTLAALEDTQLCMIPINSLINLMQNYPKLLKRMMDINSYKMQNDLQGNIAINANQYVANFLLNISSRLVERQRCSSEIILPVSQLEMSYFLGMAHETVNRIMRKLAKEKITKIKNKKIYVIDINRLKQIGTTIIDNQSVILNDQKP